MCVGVRVGSTELVREVRKRRVGLVFEMHNGLVLFKPPLWRVRKQKLILFAQDHVRAESIKDFFISLVHRPFYHPVLICVTSGQTWDDFVTLSMLEWKEPMGSIIAVYLSRSFFFIFFFTNVRTDLLFCLE